MKSNIKKELDKLSQTDIYSLIMFGLFKLKEHPNYATLSELVYLLNEDSLFKLISYFGGMTVTIPTKRELKTIINALILYQLINVEQLDYDEALKQIKLDCVDFDINEIKLAYKNIVDILSKYDFKRK